MPQKSVAGQARRQQVCSKKAERLQSLFAAAVFLVPAPPARAVIVVIADATTVFLPVISPPALIGRENDAGWRF
jgi:hypothetical protein